MLHLCVSEPCLLPQTTHSTGASRPGEQIAKHPGLTAVRGPFPHVQHLRRCITWPFQQLTATRRGPHGLSGRQQCTPLLGITILAAQQQAWSRYTWQAEDDLSPFLHDEYERISLFHVTTRQCTLGLLGLPEPIESKKGFDDTKLIYVACKARSSPTAFLQFEQCMLVHGIIRPRVIWCNEITTFSV